MLKWVLFGEIFISAYLAMLIQQLNLCVSPLGVALTVIFSPSLILLLVSFLYVLQSGILGDLTRNRPALALTTLGIATLYVLAFGIAEVMAASYSPDVLASHEAEGWLLVSIGGGVCGVAAFVGIFILMRECMTWCR